VKEERIFHSLNAYVTGSIDPGLLIIEGKINPDQEAAAAEQRLWNELRKLQASGFSAEEVEKVKNQSETALAGSEIEALNKAINLAYFAILGHPEEYRMELEKIQQLSREEIEETFRNLIQENRCNTLIYKANSSVS
jgi:zinc protease